MSPPVFGGLPEIAAGLGANAISKAAMDRGPVFSTIHTEAGARVYAVQSMNTNRETGPRLPGPHPGDEGNYNTVAKVTLTGSADSINYMFELFNLDNHRAVRIDTNNFKGGSLTKAINMPPSSIPSLGLTGLEFVRKFASFDSDTYEMIPDTIDIGFEDYDYTILKASSKTRQDDEEDGMFYAEVWTNYGSSDSDYLVGGFWLLTPGQWSNTDSYRFSAFARGNKLFGREDVYKFSVDPALEGTATYEGPAAGLHISTVDGMTKISRLLGKVTMNADFDDGTYGTLGGRIHGLNLDGKQAGGEILLPKHNLSSYKEIGPASDSALEPSLVPSPQPMQLGNINGINMMGEWGALFTGATGTEADSRPSGVVGVVSGHDSTKTTSFSASFGATLVQDDE